MSPSKRSRSWRVVTRDFEERGGEWTEVYIYAGDDRVAHVTSVEDAQRLVDEHNAVVIAETIADGRS